MLLLRRVHCTLILSASLFVSSVLLMYFNGGFVLWNNHRGGRLNVKGGEDVAKQKVLDVTVASFRNTSGAGESGNATEPDGDAGLRGQCTPRTNIAFLKMHKCSSSTVQNLLFRYGEAHGLDFALPPQGNYLGHPSRVFSRGDMMEFPVSRYNILCHHTRFSYKGMLDVLSKDAVFTTILRDPVTMYESMFNYLLMGNDYHLPKKNALKLFLEKPEFYYNISQGRKCKARNPMLFDMGLDESLLGDAVRIQWKIEQLKRQLHLVMITEYFEESLVLLKHLLCWQTDDMVYFILNARSKPSINPVSPETADKIRRWNFGDVALYETFNRTFWEKVAAFGHDRMRREVAELKERNRYFREHCIAQVVNTDSKVWRPAGIQIDSFQLKPEATRDKMCVQMARTELPYSEHIRHLQLAKYRFSKKHKV